MREGWEIVDHPRELPDGSRDFLRHRDGRVVRWGESPKNEETETTQTIEDVFRGETDVDDPTIVLELQRRLAESREISVQKSAEIRKLEATRISLQQELQDQEARIIRLRDFGTSVMVLALALGVVIAVQNVFVPLLREEKKPRLNKDAPAEKKQEEPSLSKSTSQFQVYRFDDFKKKETDNSSQDGPHQERAHSFLFNKFHEDMEKLLMGDSARSIGRPLIFDSTVFPRSKMPQWRPHRLGGVRLTGSADIGTGTSTDAAPKGGAHGAPRKSGSSPEVIPQP